MFTIQGFHTANSPTHSDLRATSKSYSRRFPMVTCGPVQNSVNFELPGARIPAGVSQGKVLLPLSVSYSKQGSFSCSIQCHVLRIFVIFVGDFTVYNGPQA